MAIDSEEEDDSLFCEAVNEGKVLMTCVAQTFELGKKVQKNKLLINLFRNKLKMIMKYLFF